jgi:hypothetical protein
MILDGTTHIVEGTRLIFNTQKDLLMLKQIAPFAIGLLTVVSIAPSSQAITAAAAQPQSMQQPSRDLHAQIQIIIGGGQPEYRGGYYYRREAERLRRLEIERERARVLAEERRRQEYYSRRHRSHGGYRVEVYESGDYRGGRDGYHGGYRR